MKSLEKLKPFFLAGTVLSLWGIIPLAYAVDDAEQTSSLILWLSALPDWVFVAIVSVVSVVLFLLGFVAYRRWFAPSPAETGGEGKKRAGFYSALAGAIVGIVVGLLTLEMWDAYLYEQIIRLPAPAAGPPADIEEKRAEVENLTKQLKGLTEQYKALAQSEQAVMAENLRTLAKKRWQLLGEFIENDPSEVLKQALPDDVFDKLPEKVQVFLELRMELEGELQLLHVDYKDQSQSHYVYLLSTDKGERYSLHFEKEGPDVLSGTRVRVKGLALSGIKTRDAGETEGALAINNEDGSNLIFLEAGGSKNTSSSGTTTTTLPNTLGAQKTLVILVNFQDNPIQPYTSADAQNMIFGTTSDFFFENSYQQTLLSGDVAGWFTLPIDGAGCDYFSIQTYAEAAASAAGFDLSAYKHLVYAFPQSSCGWAGLSSLGGNPSWTWINNDKLKLGVWAHELGHTLGLYHSHSLDCDATTLGSNCNQIEYGDTLDTMGASSYNYHFNAFQKERLGWLATGVSPPVTTVLSDGTYTLEPYETGGSGPKALKILKSTDPNTGKRTWYYVQFRQAIGFDGALAGNTNILNGVVFNYGTESNGNSSYFLDMTPGSGSTIYYDWKDPALVVGQTYEDSAAGISLTTEWVTTTEAAVTVHFGGGVSSNQSTLAISTDQSSYSLGQTVTATAMLTSGGIPVANASVSFSFTKPNGSVVTATATSGNDGTAKAALRLRKQDPVGIYRAVGAIDTSSAETDFTVQ